MEVHVQVAVQMRESETGRREGGELRLDLAPELDAAAASHVLPGVAQAGQDRTVAVDPVLLFRFSALTYNAHRIHYDRDYARAEGYPGLVVHGPLQAMLTLGLLAREMPGATVRRFGFRGLAPLFDHDTVTVGGAPDAATPGKITLWTGDDAGGQSMEAWAVVEG